MQWSAAVSCDRFGGNGQMTKVIVDAELRKKLHDLREPLELCDESGQVIGRVLPIVGLSEYDTWEPPLDEEELSRREQSTTWHTTAEVLAHLKKLEGG
jgi:hypothetical protein